MGPMTNNYVAPITLGFTPANGDLIGGTVNGVEVNGKWISSSGGVKLYEGALDVSTYGGDDGQYVCSVGIIDGQALIGMESESAPTIDYELHLYRYTPADIVQIPQEYVEGLETAAADATEAKTAAETAQSTANAAKTTAEAAQSTANSIKPDWNETSTTSPKYIANRPCYKIEELTWGEEQSVTVTNELSLTGDEFYMPAKIKGTYDGTAFEFEKDMESIPGVAFWGYKEYNAGTSDIYFSQTATRDSTSITVRNDGASHAVTYQVATASVTYKQIDEEYIPNPLPKVYAFNAGSFLRVNEAGKWAIEESLILNSSTPNSTKKFKITVDDAGAISATEVTT